MAEPAEPAPRVRSELPWLVCQIQTCIQGIIKGSQVLFFKVYFKITSNLRKSCRNSTKFWYPSFQFPQMLIFYHICFITFSLYVRIVVVACLLGCVWFFATPWTVAWQAPLSITFPRQVYWSGLPFLSQEDLPDLGVKPRSPALVGGFLTTEPQESPCPIITE